MSSPVSSQPPLLCASQGRSSLQREGGPGAGSRAWPLLGQPRARARSPQALFTEQRIRELPEGGAALSAFYRRGN